MSVDHGEPGPSEVVQVRKGSRLLRLLLIAGTIAFLVPTARTFRFPGVPPVEGMQAATSVSPTLTARCEINSGGGTAPSTTCYWSFALDDGRRLAWPWPNQNGSPAQRTTYLRQHGPVTVRFWRGTVYQVELAGGQIYLDRADAGKWEEFLQWVRVLEGVGVVGASLLRIGLELRRLANPVTDPHAECWALVFDIVCLMGAFLQVATRPDLRWSGVIGLALFATAAPVVTRALAHRSRPSAFPFSRHS